jgi:hypothetical protein
MPRTSFLSLVFAVIALHPALAWSEDAPNTLTDAQQQAGWKLLFDGKTTTGWRNFGKPDISSGWKVEDGALVRAEQGAGDIITSDQYGAFELLLDYKISPAGNSGLMFHVTEDVNRPPMVGPEVQIQDNKDGHDPQKSGWMYGLYPADVDATKPAGEWNTLRILITPEKCVHWMNGAKYCEYVIGSADWNERVAKSKFAKWPEFGKPTRGHLCLQDHNSLVSFRNIKVRPITETK